MEFIYWEAFQTFHDQYEINQLKKNTFIYFMIKIRKK